MAAVDYKFDHIPHITALETWPSPEDGGEELARALLAYVKKLFRRTA